MFNYIHVNSETNVIHSIVKVSEELNNPEYIQTRDYNESIIGRIFIGVDEEGVPMLAPLVIENPQDKPEFWWIDVGPFYDRFGPDALAIAASDHGACRAVQTLTGVRKYIDLKDPRIGQMIDMLIAVQQPAAQAFAPGSGPMTATKKAAILSTATTERERHVKGLVQEA